MQFVEETKALERSSHDSDVEAPQKFFLSFFIITLNVLSCKLQQFIRLVPNLRQTFRHEFSPKHSPARIGVGYFWHHYHVITVVFIHAAATKPSSQDVGVS